MTPLSEYMERVVHANNFPTNVDGTKTSATVMLISGISAKVEYDVINTNKRVIVRSGIYAPPLSRHGRDRFFQSVLHFNRDCLYHLHGAGVMPFPSREDVYAFTWLAPKAKMSAQEWDVQIGVFDQLANHANHVVRSVMEQWINYPH